MPSSLGQVKAFEYSPGRGWIQVPIHSIFSSSRKKAEVLQPREALLEGEKALILILVSISG
jgi:hypothetical protein